MDLFQVVFVIFMIFVFVLAFKSPSEESKSTIPWDSILNTPQKFPSFDKSEQFQDNIEDNPKMQKLLKQLDKMEEEKAVQYIEANFLEHPEKILFNLGIIKYEKENYRSALYLFNEASNKGHKYSKYMKGLLCFNGQGVEKDLKEAYTCFKQTSSTVHESNYILGNMYEYGLYVEKNLSKAYYYYDIASKQGNRKAITRKKELLSLPECSSSEEYTSN